MRHTASSVQCSWRCAVELLGWAVQCDRTRRTSSAARRSSMVGGFVDSCWNDPVVSLCDSATEAGSGGGRASLSLTRRRGPRSRPPLDSTHLLKRNLDGRTRLTDSRVGLPAQPPARPALCSPTRHSLKVVSLPTQGLAAHSRQRPCAGLQRPAQRSLQCLPPSQRAPLSRRRPLSWSATRSPRRPGAA